MKQLYVALERGLRELLGNLGHQLTDGEILEIEQFIDVAEYGIALETLCWILTEHGGAHDIMVHDQIAALANLMELKSKPIRTLLEPGPNGS
ncbi:MAG TPA: MafI family immunity protein [Pirellulales bacterium]|jgi:hypothetical protein|nr:MafI family immunity protein [Pirellulales bacterium]